MKTTMAMATIASALMGMKAIDMEKIANVSRLHNLYGSLQALNVQATFSFQAR